MLGSQARQTLFASSWLRGLPHDAAEEAAALFEEMVVPQGTVLFRQGEVADALYLLVTGAVDLSIDDHALTRLVH